MHFFLDLLPLSGLTLPRYMSVADQNEPVELPASPEVEDASSLELFDETPIEAQRILSEKQYVEAQRLTWKGAKGKSKRQEAAEFVKEFASEIVRSESYRESLRRRILKDELPSGVETALLYIFAGKPKEMLELSTKNGQPLVTEVIRRVVRPKAEA